MEEERLQEAAYLSQTMRSSSTMASAPPQASTMPRKYDYDSYQQQQQGTYVVGQDYNPSHTTVETVRYICKLVSVHIVCLLF